MRAKISMFDVGAVKRLRARDVQTSYKSSNYVLGLIFVVNIKFPRATYHTIVPSTEKLYCLNRKCAI